MLKNQSLRNGSRYNFLDIKFWRKFKKDTGIDIEYRDFISIIDFSNRKIKEKVVNNPSGFKLPEQMGFLAISKYKNKKRKVDYKKSKELGTKVYHINFHSNGYDARIMWYTNQIASCKHVDEYKFVPDREFTTMKSNKLKEGKNYNEYNYDDFKAKKIRINLDKLLYGTRN